MAEPRPENPRDRIVPGAWDGTYAVEAERVPEAAGAVDVAFLEAWLEYGPLTAHDGFLGRLAPTPVQQQIRKALDALAAANARAERLAASWAEVEEIGRSLDLVGFDLNDGLVCQHAERLREIARAALAGDAPGRGEG